MTIPRIIRDMIKYLLKRSWKVFLRKLTNLLYIDKCRLKMASPVWDFLQEMQTVRRSPLVRLCP
jgi:hypothetical protein